MIYFLSFGFVLLGTALLCLSMQKHFRVFWKISVANNLLRKGMRAAGYISLGIALYIGSQADDFGIALTTVFGIFTVVHIAMAIFISQREISGRQSS